MEKLYLILWWNEIRYIEYQIVIGDAHPTLITEDIRALSTPEKFEIEEEPKDYDKEALFPEPVIRHLSKTSYVWNFSLIYHLTLIFSIGQWIFFIKV